MRSCRGRSLARFAVLVWACLAVPAACAAAEKKGAQAHPESKGPRAAAKEKELAATAGGKAGRGAPAAPAPTPDVAALKALKAREIGPAVMGGRVSDIAFDAEDAYTFYIGLATGGVMKTSNNGGSFEAVFEKEAVASIGALAVCRTNAKIVWVGTGEANDRNSSGWGNGVYRSADAGASWTNVGLKNSKTIARIVTHPADSRGQTH